MNKHEILVDTVIVLGDAAMFSPEAYITGEGYDYNNVVKNDTSEHCSLIIKTIEEFESLGMVSAEAYLKGEGYSIEEIEEILS
jgi:hypothetical protein